MLLWIKSLLFNRKQSVLFEGARSDWVSVSSGVPQGSVIGPILFNLYVADLPDVVFSSLRQYADDTVLYRTINSLHYVNVLQADLNNIALWCQNNFMSLNISKCKLMHITRSRKLIDTNYVISGQPLEAVKCYKYLGFIVSCDLSWTSHVRSM